MSKEANVHTPEETAAFMEQFRGSQDEWASLSPEERAQIIAQHGGGLLPSKGPLGLAEGTGQAITGGRGLGRLTGREDKRQVLKQILTDKALLDKSAAVSTVFDKMTKKIAKGAGKTKRYGGPTKFANRVRGYFKGRKPRVGFNNVRHA